MTDDNSQDLPGGWHAGTSDAKETFHLAVSSSNPTEFLRQLRANFPAPEVAFMEPAADKDIELPSSNEEGNVSSRISPEQFQINCLECPVCYRLSQEGSIEARNTFRKAKVPPNLPDEFWLSFHELESTWKG